MAARGTVGERQRLVEPTSGNTGMGPAMLANLKGYELTTPLSTEIPAKNVMLKFAGAQVEELQDTLALRLALQRAPSLVPWNSPSETTFTCSTNTKTRRISRRIFAPQAPEIWRQMRGEITHFVSAMGTCGTLTGNGRYLKGQNPDIQVIGAHPNEGHDIPGVRSLRQLQQTQLFRPDEYDGLVEIHNDDAYAMCLRLNREEGVIAGPSAALGLLGALARVEDKPGNKVVVIFADNIYKYASSFERHFPDFQVAGSSSAPAEPSVKERYFERMVEHTKAATAHWKSMSSKRSLGRG